MFAKKKFITLLLGLVAAASQLTANPIPRWDGKIDSVLITQKLADMSFEEKLGQLFLVGPEPGKELALGTRLVKELYIGGIFLTQNGGWGEAVEILELANELQDASGTVGQGLPLLIAVDQENGSTRTIKSPVTELPSAMALGATCNLQAIYRTGKITGVELAAMGVNVNLAPVVDLNSNSANDIIADRSFGSRSDLVGIFAAEFLRGLHDGGVIAVPKHFPGHGDTDTDPHEELPKVLYNERTIEPQIDPFRRVVVDQGAYALMTAHIAFPNLNFETANRPFSLSPRAINKWIRSTSGLAFDGVVITDDVVYMKAAHFAGGGAAEAAELALRSGADMVILDTVFAGDTPAEMNEVGLKDLLNTVGDHFRGHLDELDKSVARILRMKAAFAPTLYARDVNKSKEGLTAIKTRDHRISAYKIARQSITLINDPRSLFGKPTILQRIDPQDPILVVSHTVIRDDITFLLKRRDYKNIRSIPMLYNQSFGRQDDDYFTKVKDDISNYFLNVTPKLIIFGVVDDDHVAVFRWLKQELMNRDLFDRTVVVSFRVPNQLTKSDIANVSYLAAYSNLTTLNDAVVSVIGGEITARSLQNLPISIPGIHDDDATCEGELPTVSVLTSNIQVNETDNEFSTQVDFSLQPAAFRPFRISYQLKDDTAVFEEDYDGEQSGIIDVAADDIKFSVPITILGDSIQEDTERFTVMISTDAALVEVNQGVAEVIIFDDDQASKKKSAGGVDNNIGGESLRDRLFNLLSFLLIVGVALGGTVFVFQYVERTTGRVLALILVALLCLLGALFMGLISADQFNEMFDKIFEILKSQREMPP